MPRRYARPQTLFVLSLVLAFLTTLTAVGSANAAPAPVNGKFGAALMGAASRGDTAEVKRLLAQGADPNARNFLKITPLMVGAMLGDPEMARALLAAGAEREATSLFGTALTFAAQSGNEPVLRYLLHRGADVNAARPDGITVLMLAARADRPAVVRELLERKAPIDARDNNGGTALLYAARAGSLAAARVLLQHSAAVESADQQGWTPLMHAAVNGHTDVVTLLLTKGARVDARDRSGRTALLLTASYGDHPATLRALLAGGAAIDTRDARGQTASAIAVARGYTGNVLALRGQGAVPIASTVAPSPKTPEQAVAASLPLLEHSMQVFADRTGCASCHQEGLGRIATGLARQRGVAINEELARAQAKRVFGFFTERHPFFAKAVEDPHVLKALSDDTIGEITPFSGYVLSGLAAHAVPASPMLAAEAVVLARQQAADGGWTVFVSRVPMSSSRFTMTALALRALRAYAPADRAAEMAGRIARAKHWLLTAAATTPEDQAMRLLGLKWAQRGTSAGGGPEEREKAIQALRASQRPDGGWAQLASLPSDAYATGQALFALNQAGDIPVTDPAYRRGMAFLLRTQGDDGSWFVSKRAMPLNDYFDAGFPHGQSQFSSFNGTCWATMALLLAIEPRQGGRVAAR
jgi:ankyrin repeat protein